ncbi:MAG: hypothetical protein H0U75_08735 [Legionella sp.]|nr:hypothetical protein [Legionella sp.]
MPNLSKPFKEPFNEFPNPYSAAKEGKLTGAIYKLLRGNIATIGLLDCLLLFPLFIKVLSRKARYNGNNWYIVVPLNILSAIFYWVYTLIFVPLSILILPICWLATLYYSTQLKNMEAVIGAMEVLSMEQLLPEALAPNEDTVTRARRLPLGQWKDLFKSFNVNGIKDDKSILQEILYQNFYKHSSKLKPSLSTLQSCCGSNLDNFVICPINLKDANDVDTGAFVFGLYKTTFNELHSFSIIDQIPTCFIIPCRENAQHFTKIRLMKTFNFERIEKYFNTQPLDSSLLNCNPFIKMAQNRAKQMFTALGVSHYTPKCEIQGSVEALMPEIMKLAGFGDLEIESSQLSSFVSTWSPRLFSSEVPAKDGEFQSQLSMSASNE